jgi:hypothetical protein
LVPDSHNILNMQNYYYCQLLNVHRVSYVRQIEIHTAECDPSLPEVEIAIAKSKKYKQPGIHSSRW